MSEQKINSIKPCFMKTSMLKKLLILPLVFMAGTLIAQPPPGINFQAVAKDATGNPAKNRKVFVIEGIIQKNINSPVIWEEAFEVMTNEDGVYTITIGLGKRTATPQNMNLQTIKDIDWGSGPFFLKMKMAVAPSIPASWWVASDNYVDMGTQQMMSVPFALYAANASVTNVNTGITAGAPNTFLVTDSTGNVRWATPKAANQNVTYVSQVNFTSQYGSDIIIQPNTTSTVEMSVPGVEKGDPLIVTAQGDYINWSVYSYWVSDSGKVKIRFANFTEDTVSVKGSEYKIVIIK